MFAVGLGSRFSGVRGLLFLRGMGPRLAPRTRPVDIMGQGARGFMGTGDRVQLMQS